MTERSFNDDFWDDKLVQSLDHKGKLLFIYLWTNKRCNPAGVYRITPKTISFDTGLSEGDIPTIFTSIERSVKWMPEDNLVWIKNFIKHQTKSSKFLEAGARILEKMDNNGLREEVLVYNKTIHRITIPYLYYRDKATIPTDTNADTDTSTVTVSKNDGYNDDRKLLFEGLKERRDYNAPNAGMEAKAMTWMLKQGYSVQQILSTYDGLKADPFWVDKWLSMQSVRNQIGEAVKTRPRRKDEETVATKRTIRTYRE